MRLLTKTTLYFLTAMTVLLIIAGYYLFSRFSWELNRKSDQELLQEEVVWIKYLQNEMSRGVTVVLRAPDVSIYPVEVSGEKFPAIADINDGPGKITYRQLTQVVSVYGVSYQIILRKSQEQKAALIAYTTRIILLVFAGLLLATFLYTWLISKNLWNPFYRSLNKVRQADLQTIQNTVFEKETGTTEFNELNASLNSMTAKIQADFVNMKEFTENAAHEMQTPLSAAKSKLELLLQSEHLQGEDVQSILEASDALSRLSKLNQELLLLAKIENQQYPANQELNLNEVTKKYIGLLSELIHDKQLNITTDYANEFRVQLHPLLADTLISNLLGNAIRHNYSGGRIDISVNGNSYSISNTTHAAPIAPEKLFKRFAATSAESGSNGLGLAIVKKIADTNGLEITYEHEDGQVTLRINRK
ncbi:sensor histidine kinase [Pollutibacter soli]|uniref:sensor histidine kinase n=1 Tax=Pollutibacter soli TaxID=3034157 RepID=UPI003013572D